MTLRLLAVAAVLLAGTGCVTVPERAPVQDVPGAWQARQQALAPVSRWEIRGRMALRNAEEGWHASLVWVREKERYQIDLNGPLGRGHVRLSQDRDGAVLRDADQNEHRGASSEELLERATGFHMPLAGLDYWVRGLPAPQSEPHMFLDSHGRLVRLRQLGWEIEYLEYTTQDGHELPSKLFARRITGDTHVASAAPVTSELLEVRLVIERWVIK